MEINTEMPTKTIIVQVRGKEESISLVIGGNRIQLNSNEAQSLLRKLSKAISYEQQLEIAG